MSAHDSGSRPATRTAKPTGESSAATFPSREAYRRIALYDPDRAPCAIDLSDNTNRWGVPPSAAASIPGAGSEIITRYPSLYALGLKQALANYLGVGHDTIVTGCGSDDVLDSAIRAVAEPGDRVVFPEPSFMMIPLFARMNGLEPVAVRLTKGLDIDAEAMLAARGRITYICSPNNPTGTLASRRAVEKVIDRADGLVIIDEAYAEFSSETFIRDALSSERVLVVRTMSKAFGLAGLRIGYATGHPRLVAEVEKSRGPYKISAVAEQAAIAALTQDMPWVEQCIAEALDARERLSAALAALEVFDPVPSEANFVLAVVRHDSGLRAADMARRLREHGVAVRPFSDLPGIGDALRITVAPWPIMQKCLAALELVCTEGKTE